MLAFLLPLDFEVCVGRGPKKCILGAIAPSPPPFSPCHRSAGQPKARPALWWQGEKGGGEGARLIMLHRMLHQEALAMLGAHTVHLLVPRAPIQALAWPTPHEAGPGGPAWALLWDPPVHLLVPRAPIQALPWGPPPWSWAWGALPGPCGGTHQYTC